MGNLCCSKDQKKLKSTERNQIIKILKKSQTKKDFIKGIQSLQKKDYQIDKIKAKDFFNLMLELLNCDGQYRQQFFTIFLLYNFILKYSVSWPVYKNHAILQKQKYYVEEYAKKLNGNYAFQNHGSSAWEKKFYQINVEHLNRISSKINIIPDWNSFCEKYKIPREITSFLVKDLLKLETISKEMGKLKRRKSRWNAICLARTMQVVQQESVYFEKLQKEAKYLKEQEVMKMRQEEIEFYDFKQLKQHAEEMLEIFMNIELQHQNNLQWKERQFYIEHLTQEVYPDIYESVKYQEKRDKYEKNIQKFNTESDNSEEHEYTQNHTQNNSQDNINIKNYDDNDNVSQHNNEHIKDESKENNQIIIHSVSDEETNNEFENDYLDSLITENERMKNEIEAMKEQKTILKSKIKEHKVNSSKIYETKTQNFPQVGYNDLYFILQEKEHAIQKMKMQLENLEQQHKSYVYNDHLDEEIKNTDVMNAPRQFLEETMFLEDQKSMMLNRHMIDSFADSNFDFLIKKKRFNSNIKDRESFIRSQLIQVVSYNYE